MLSDIRLRIIILHLVLGGKVMMVMALTAEHYFIRYSYTLLTGQTTEAAEQSPLVKGFIQAQWF